MIVKNLQRKQIKEELNNSIDLICTKLELLTRNRTMFWISINSKLLQRYLIRKHTWDIWIRKSKRCSIQVTWINQDHRSQLRCSIITNRSRLKLRNIRRIWTPNKLKIKLSMLKDRELKLNTRMRLSISKNKGKIKRTFIKLLKSSFKIKSSKRPQKQSKIWCNKQTKRKNKMMR